MKKLLLLSLALLCLGNSQQLFSQQQAPVKLNPIFIITDIKGNTMEVTELRVRIVQGSDISLTTECDVMSGEAEITIDLNDVEGFRNYWKKREVKFFFPNGQTLMADLPKGVEYNEVRGFAIIAGRKVPYKLPVSKLLSAFRKGFTPTTK